MQSESFKRKYLISQHFSYLKKFFTVEKKMTAEEFLNFWEKKKEHLTREYKRRAEKASSQLEARIKAICQERDTEHCKWISCRPKEPHGLFAFFRRKQYEHDLSQWNEEFHQISVRSESRQKRLRSRLHRLDALYKHFPRLAEERLKKQFPDVFLQVPYACAELQKKKETQKNTRLILQFLFLAAQRKKRAPGHTNSCWQWKQTPEPLREVIESFNTHSPKIQKALIKRIHGEKETLQTLSRYFQQQEKNLQKEREYDKHNKTGSGI